jgi:hypothetical protein
MAKAILEYDLNEFDDKQAHLRAVKSTDMAIVLHDIQYNLHKRIEHQLEVGEYTIMDVVQMYRSEIAELFEENSIDLDDLIR